MKLLYLSIATIITMIFLFFYNNNNVEGVEMCTFGILLFNMIYSLMDIKRRFIFFAFQITFLVFLLGQNFATLLSTSEGIFTKSIEEEFHTGTQLHIYFLLFISLLGFFIGYSLNEQKKIKQNKIKIDTDSIYITKLRSYSKKAMYFFSIFAIAVVIEKAVFVQSVGYVDLYTTFVSFLPSFFYRFETLYEVSLFLYLATFPKWNECKWALLLYFSIGILSLFFGQRNAFVLNMLFIVIYFSLRHLYKVYGKSEVWINKKRIATIFIAFPFLLFFLYSFGSTRFDNEAKSYDNPIDNTLAFFAQQGGSVRLIGYEKDFSDRNQFPSDAPPYTFGYLIDLYQQNAFFKAFNVYPSYAPHSEERALKGHNFGEIISYLYDPIYYFAGFGLGSCYIAELHHDFGIVGVFLINFLYGLIFALLYKYANKNVWGLFFCLIITMNVLYAPRATALFFLNQLLAPSFIVFLAIIYFMTKKYRHIKIPNQATTLNSKDNNE